MRDEVIDRVAKAMAKADADNPAWRLYVREAHAAIEEIRLIAPQCSDCGMKFLAPLNYRSITDDKESALK